MQRLNGEGFQPTAFYAELNGGHELPPDTLTQRIQAAYELMQPLLQHSGKHGLAILAHLFERWGTELSQMLNLAPERAAAQQLADDFGPPNPDLPGAVTVALKLNEHLDRFNRFMSQATEQQERIAQLVLDTLDKLVMEAQQESQTLEPECVRLQEEVREDDHSALAGLQSISVAPVDEPTRQAFVAYYDKRNQKKRAELSRKEKRRDQCRNFCAQVAFALPQLVQGVARLAAGAPAVRPIQITAPAVG